MKNQELSFFDKYKAYFKYSEGLEKSNPKVSYQIKYFVCKTLYNNKKLLKESEIELMNKKVEEFRIFVVNSKKSMYLLKNSLDSISLEMSVDDYSDFVENLFFNVDDEDRFKLITKKTLGNFKFILDLIEVMRNFGEIQEKWIEISKTKYLN